MSIEKKTNRLHPIYWFLTGLLLFAAWPMSPFTFLVFAAWVPLLLVEEKITNPYLYFLLIWLNFLIWNATTTWWIVNASVGGGVGAIICNSFLMCCPWMLYRFTKRKIRQNLAWVALVAYWMCFEYIHQNWQLSWPWLTLGNIFSTHPIWVGWYRYTGTAGGSLWVWVVNIILYKLSERNASEKLNYKRFILPVLALLLPLTISQLATLDIKTAIGKTTTNIVVVQPNIDPYNDKFSGNPAQQIEKLIALSESKIDTNTRLVIWPETAVPVQVWEENLLENSYYRPILSFIKKHPQLQLLTGIESYKGFGKISPGGFAARQDLTTGNWYEEYNTAMALDTALQPQLYHKAKLVPGVETLPSWLGFMSKLFEDFGGTSGTLGSSKEAMVFSQKGNPYRPAPIICYESIFGSYITDYVGKGANVLTIITNDGWWGNTPGYQQHQSMARLRAIETGLWVARSANTGISCFISPTGEVFQPQPWATAAAIRMEIPTETEQTFYVKHGDWLGLLSVWVAGIFLLMTIFGRFTKSLGNQ